MRFTTLVTTGALSLIASAAPGQAGSPALDAVARTMGGKERVLGVRTLATEGSGHQLNFGQNFTPDADTRFEVRTVRRVTDFANKRWFLDVTREPRFVTAVTTPQRLRSGVDGDVGYNIAPNGNAARTSALVAADRANEMLYFPIGFIKAAYAAGTDIVEEAGPDNLRRVRINPGGVKVSMLVDPRTTLPTRIERIIDNAMLGDATMAMEFADWQDVSGLKLPMRMTQRLDRWMLSEFRIGVTRVDEDSAGIAASDSIRSAPLPVPAAINVVVEELAPGVWWIGGGTHHTIAIEQSNAIVLVEAPQGDERSLAAIAKARELRPGKPVTTVINTHHHFDHSGGLRAAISQGLTVVTHDANKDFYERVVYPRRHTIQPDALARDPKPLRLVPVRDKLIMRDSVRTIEVYEITGNPHTGTMLVVYLPAEKILVQADMYNPPAANAPPPPGFPFAANLLENIQRRGLQVDRVVGIHGRPVPLSELSAAATRAP